jgi:hypothetical protein
MRHWATAQGKQARQRTTWYQSGPFDQPDDSLGTKYQSPWSRPREKNGTRHHPRHCTHARPRRPTQESPCPERSPCPVDGDLLLVDGQVQQQERQEDKDKGGEIYRDFANAHGGHWAGMRSVARRVSTGPWSQSKIGTNKPGLPPASISPPADHAGGGGRTSGGRGRLRSCAWPASGLPWVPASVT